jgi:hypothetical protein
LILELAQVWFDTARAAIIHKRALQARYVYKRRILTQIVHAPRVAPDTMKF